MVLVFWLLAALMILVALAFILVPLLLRRRPAGGPSRIEANLEVLRGQRREIDADVASGTLPADARDEALAELVLRAQGDLEAAEAAAPAPRPARRPWVAIGLVAVLLPALAVGLYLKVGSPEAADAQLVGHQGAPLDERQIAAMVDNLARKVRDRPEDAEGWALLGRSLAALGRFPESAKAYEHLVKLVPNDPEVLADYADALGMAQGRTLSGRPYELAKQALEIDPRAPKALALAGTAALDAGDYKASIGYWERLAAVTPEGSEDRSRVEGIMAQIRKRAAAAGQALPAPAAQVASAAAPGASVTGMVSVAPAVAAQVDPSATLFVFARAENGPRMPLAVLRSTATKLPFTFTLDDAQAMTPQLRLSGAGTVRIEARISRSGNAIAQPGDLTGASDVVKPGARDVKVVIDQVVGARAAAAPAPPVASADPAAPAGGSVTGSVSVAPQLASKVDGNATLFVFARAENGPRMPLAVVRATAHALPMDFTLDDSQAMSPAFKLSGAQAVRIEARISRSGNATPQPGDLVGASGVVKPGARGVKIVVDKVLP